MGKATSLFGHLATEEKVVTTVIVMDIQTVSTLYQLQQLPHLVPNLGTLKSVHQL